MVKKKKGQKPKELVKIKMSSNFAYALGLIASDGCLYKDGRHVNFISKDEELVANLKKALAITIQVRQRKQNEKTYFYIQFSDSLFHAFLKSVGIIEAKSKTIEKVIVPRKFYFDFLRGVFDGDGSFYSYYDKRWKSSFMYYLSFASASKKYIVWIQETNRNYIGVKGCITSVKSKSTFRLKYAKKETLEIIKKMYYNDEVISLSRKREKIEKAVNK